MPKQKELIAMILAGGQGSRLGVLTRKNAKPAVVFGGKYRIIDFTLSNCVNSGIDTVGVLTQYQPLELNGYIGTGQTWDLDRIDGGVHILPPYQAYQGASWYNGTADAIYRNIDFIDSYSPENVAVLSGDHIYKMDYSKMLKAHKDNSADCTIAVLEVEMREASRFGIMNTNEDGSIYEFEEKPKNPKSNKASMGVYIFKWEKLRRYLIEDQKNESSSNDFGKNIIPNMLSAGERMFAYDFDGYWKDVGTIQSLWDANMDLLNPKLALDLDDPDWTVYSKSPVLPPMYIGKSGKAQNSSVGGGCRIDGSLDFSVLFHGVTVEEGAEVEYSIVMPNTVIKKGAKVRYAILGENVTVYENAVIGCAPEEAADPNKWDIAVIGNKVTVGKGAAVKDGAMIDADVAAAD